MAGKLLRSISCAGGQAAMAVALMACVGSDEHSRENAPGILAHIAATPSQTATAHRLSASTGAIDAAALFDWAQWKWPALFPKGPQNFDLFYQGVAYTVRAYPNGNYLGVATVNGEVYGLGDFTNLTLQGFGNISFFAAPVLADACKVGICVPSTASNRLAQVRSHEYVIAANTGTPGLYEAIAGSSADLVILGSGAYGQQLDRIAADPSGNGEGYHRGTEQKREAEAIGGPAGIDE